MHLKSSVLHPTDFTASNISELLPPLITAVKRIPSMTKTSINQVLGQLFQLFGCFGVLHPVGFRHFTHISVTAPPHHNPRDNSSWFEEDRKVSSGPSLPQAMAPLTLRPQEEGCFHLFLMWLANRANRTDNRTMTRLGFS